MPINTSENIPKTYEPKEYEEKIYQKWESLGIFNPDNFSAESGNYCNILPPPNANGELHTGHASGYVVMDLLGRYHRMLGKKTLLLPGKDHAGIQTQVVYEKKIKKEKGLSRHDLGREKFYQEVYDFCIDRSKYMRNQEKKLGLGADWSREKFTLDPAVIKIALETFVKMYNEVDEKGNRMVYKGLRIINWCPRCASALAEVEVEHEEKKSLLYTFKYSKDFPFEIATTRPETKLGDTAVAVNPNDKRYQEYIGKTFKVDFAGVPLKLKVIADPQIDMEFGTGALGVTPAHSFVDWEMAQKNKLETVKVINESGEIAEGFGEFSKKTSLQAREMIVEKLRRQGLLKKEEPIQNNISVCERCKTTIEPLPSEQWFINVDHKNFSLKKEARKIVESEQIKIHPKRFKKIMLEWIDNVHDWCISRQIWWGPRIPAWYNLKSQKSKVKSQTIDSETKTEEEIYVGLEPPAGEGWIQDEDTFDTWFSSGQWAYTTLGYPNGKDFKDFYPSDNMIMGRDILPFWAFRMIILSLYRTRQIPFKNLYFTGLVRDELGQKMSKSKGNGIEPLEMIEKYGTDAVRMSLLVGSSAGNDMNLGEAKIEGYRNFVNKLWNISRFILSKKQLPPREETLNRSDCTVCDLWILEKMKSLVKQTTENIENYHFSQAGESLRSFMWEELADWYIETSKFEKNEETKNSILRMILKDLLRLWHPFVPFVTEAIWEQLEKTTLATQPWPKTDAYEKIVPTKDSTRNGFEEIIKPVVTAIRNARSEYKIEPSKKINVVIYAGRHTDLLTSQENIIKNLRTGIEKLEIKKSGPKLSKTIYTSLGEIEIHIPLEGIVDLGKEKIRLKKELESLEKFSNSINAKLSNENFLKNAPAEVVEKEKEKLLLQQNKITKIKTYLKSIE